MYRVIKIGMDVHSKTYTLCAVEVHVIGGNIVLVCETVDADPCNVVKFIECLKENLGSNDEYDIECGYEAGCLGFSLYDELTAMNIKCRIIAPSTILQPNGKRIKTDARDAEWLAQHLAWGTCEFVHIPTDKDLEDKEFIRMRNDLKDALKRIKQQINAFCLRHGHRYPKSKWTGIHLKWLRSLKLSESLRRVLDEYLAAYNYLASTIARLDAEIAQRAAEGEHAEKVKELCCLSGVQDLTALSTIVETGDFKRFDKGSTYAAYLGLAPGEHSSGEHICRTGITKAGNSQIRRLLIESASGIVRGRISHKSKALAARQAGNRPEIIAYADKARIRLLRKYHRMINRGKNRNLAVTAIARELACFIWGIMTDNIGLTEREMAAA